MNINTINSPFINLIWLIENINDLSLFQFFEISFHLRPDASEFRLQRGDFLLHRIAGGGVSVTADNDSEIDALSIAGAVSGSTDTGNSPTGGGARPADWSKRSSCADAAR